MSIGQSSEYSYLLFYGYRIDNQKPRDSQKPRSTKMREAGVGMDFGGVPPKSPKRMLSEGIRKYNDIKSSVVDESPSMSDSSSFDEQSFFSHSGDTNESIFSKNSPPHSESSHEKDPIDFSSIEDIDMLLNEIDVDDNGESGIIFSVDEVISVVAIKQGRVPGSERRLTCINV